MTPIPDYCSTYEVPHRFSAIALRIIAIVNVFVAGPAFYCILWHTPRGMQFYKWLLLLNQFWTALYSHIITHGLLPIMFLPFPVMYFRGWFSDLGVPPVLQLSLCTVIFNETLFSMLFLFFYRHQVLLSDNSRFKLSQNSIVRIIVANILLVFLLTASLKFNIADQEESFDKILQNWDHPPCDLWHPQRVVLMNDENIVSTLTNISPMIAMLLMICFIFHSFHLMNRREVVSAATRQKQKTFLRSLMYMAFLPSISFIFPSTYIMIAYKMSGQNTVNGN
ncbi:unnamed protein product [Caenorhabditis bovis]|uniref:G protein-coupled receptor n=1 Tax=Caenorhabditis bovis TaxID=2654633 RepID=A0A8S1ECS0_9PELO|nr:unnamed protein product [Caenorhabditis bovis]